MEDKYQKFKNQPFSSEQWFVIKNAIDDGVDVSEVANVRFTVQQMKILIQAKKSGIDLGGIADPDLTEEQMEGFIHKISEEMGVYNEHYEKVRRKWLTNITWMSVLIAVITVITLSIYLTKDEWMKYFDELYLKLTESKIQLEAGDRFDPTSYVKTYDQESELKLPDTNAVDTQTPGTYKALYRITNGKKSKEYELIVVVKDTKAPVIRLKTESISVNESTKLKPEEYIISADDQAEGNLTKKIKSTITTDKIIYEVEDSSGNKAQKEISIKWLKKTQENEKNKETVEKADENKEIPSKTPEDKPQSDPGALENPDNSNRKMPEEIIQNEYIEPQYFPFEEGEDFDGAYQRCMLEAKNYSGSISCEPYKGEDEIYIGYVLKSMN